MHLTVELNLSIELGDLESVVGNHRVPLLEVYCLRVYAALCIGLYHSFGIIEYHLGLRV